MEHVRSVAVGFWAGVGSRDEAGDEAGASHFLEHLLFKGTATRSSPAIAEAIDEVGGDLNAFTTREYTAFEVRLLAEHLELGIDVLSDIFWRPAFRPDEVEVEREVILEEILSAGDEPGDLVHDLLVETMFPDDPIGRSILGTQNSIDAMTRDAIAAFHEQRYLPGNVVVAAAGALHHDEVVAAVAERGSGGRRGTAPVDRRPLRPVAGAVRRDVRDTEQVHIAVGVRGVERDAEERFPLEMIVHALGGGLSSRLFQEVRERRGLAYNVFASRAGYEGAGLVSLYAGTAPRNVQTVLDLFAAALDDIATNGISERELEIAKGGVRASVLLGLEDSGARMARLGRTQLVQGHVPTIDEIVGRFDAVTLEEVAKLAADLFDDEATVAVVGPASTR